MLSRFIGERSTVGELGSLVIDGTYVYYLQACVPYFTHTCNLVHEETSTVVDVTKRGKKIPRALLFMQEIRKSQNVTLNYAKK